MLAVEPDVLAAVGPDLPEAGPERRQGDVLRGRRDVGLVRGGIGVLGDGQEVEDPAAAVVDAHDVQVDPGTARREQAAGVVL